MGQKKEALEEFDNRQPEAAELEAFHSRFLRQEVLNDLKLSRLNSVRSDVDKLLGVSGHDQVLISGLQTAISNNFKSFGGQLREC